MGENENKKSKKTFLSDFIGVFKEKTMIRAAKYQLKEYIFLLIRNIFVVLTAILFITSFFVEGSIMHLLRANGYILGAFAYFAEILMLTEGFSKKLAYEEMFMAYWFCPIYIMMAIAYILETFKG